jgi:hypothetical protein
MKKILLSMFALLLLVTVAPFPISASQTQPAPANPVERSAAWKSLNTRLETIQQVDKTNLDFGERRALKQEAKSIKKQMRVLNGGVYLSAGAVIVIVLLLILLL